MLFALLASLLLLVGELYVAGKAEPYREEDDVYEAGSESLLLEESVGRAAVALVALTTVAASDAAVVVVV
jgi:hypothetical protein